MAGPKDVFGGTAEGFGEKEYGFDTDASKTGGGEFARGKPKDLEESAMATDVLSILGEGANDLAVYAAALGEGGNKSDIPRACSAVSDGI
jgi:hypothetical protein